MAASCSSANVQKQQEDNQEAICGGFSEVRDVTEEDLAVFLEATGNGNPVFVPVQVSTQVVAGLNYKFICKKVDEIDPAMYEIKIFKPLQAKAEITEILKLQ